MITMKVILKVADFGNAPRDRHTIIASVTNNLGSKGTFIKCYNSRIDQDVSLEIVAVDFWTNKALPLYTLSEKLVSISLEQLDLYSPECI